MDETILVVGSVALQVHVLTTWDFSTIVEVSTTIRDLFQPEVAHFQFILSCALAGL
jgi:hypothetical protein